MTEKNQVCQNGKCKADAQVHVLFGHTTDNGKESIKFLKEYSPMMGAVYCGFICEQRYNCAPAEKHLPHETQKNLELKLNPDLHCEHPEGLKSTLKQVIAEHLDRHKWFRRIENKNDAITSFMKDYEFLIEELYCENACPYRNDCNTSKDLKSKSEMVMQKIKEAS